MQRCVSNPWINDKWMAFTGKCVARLRKRDSANCWGQKNITWRRWASPIHTRLLRAWWCRYPTSNMTESSPCSLSRWEFSCLQERVGGDGNSGWFWGRLWKQQQIKTGTWKQMGRNYQQFEWQWHLQLTYPVPLLWCFMNMARSLRTTAISTGVVFLSLSDANAWEERKVEQKASTK